MAFGYDTPSGNAPARLGLRRPSKSGRGARKKRRGQVSPQLQRTETLDDEVPQDVFGPVGLTVGRAELGKRRELLRAQSEVPRRVQRQPERRRNVGTGPRFECCTRRN